MYKLLLRFGYAMFWSSYVCAVLCGLLVFSTLISGVVMKMMVENPSETKEELNFDYTQKRPVAFACGGFGCGLNCKENKLWPRDIPPYQKLQGAEGKVIASKRQPCMLKFKSELVQALVTFFKIATLLTGYMSETHILKVNFRDIIGVSCIRVVLEQRAGYQPGAGIPEIYDAFLKLESELPFVKRIIWSWMKTMSAWISIMLFIVKLMFALLCCRSLLIPKSRQRDVSPVNSSSLLDLLN